MAELTDEITEKQDVYEDEINLMDHFIVLWKHKRLVLLGSVLPALIVGLAIFFAPSRYETTYVYDVSSDLKGDLRGDLRDGTIDDLNSGARGDLGTEVGDAIRGDISDWNLNEKNYHVFASRFYSEENSNKIINKLRESGLNEYVGSMLASGNSLGALKRVVTFEPVPSYKKFSEVILTNIGQLERIRKIKAQLLRMTIVGSDKEKLLDISSVIRDNLENVIPVYTIQNQLSADIRTYKIKMAYIESNRFDLVLNFKTTSDTLEEFRTIKGSVSDEAPREVVLQFEIGSNTEYLPLKYQVRAMESQLIQIRKQIAINKAKYKYYENVLALNEKLLGVLQKGISSDYTIGEYRSFLIKLIDEYEAEELKDYLKSYIKKIENRIAVSVPVTDNPIVFPMDKGIAKKSAIVFAVALIISVFAVFLLKALEKSRDQAS